MVGNVVTHTVTAAVGGTNLPVQAVDISQSDSRQPAINVTLTSAGTFAASIDPRTAGTLELHLSGQPIVGSVDFYRLSIRTVEQDAATGDVKITAASREAWAMDKAYTGATTLGPSTWAGVEEAVTDLLVTYMGESTTYTSSLAYFGTGVGAAQVSGISILTGDQWWTLLQDIPQRVGARLWVDPSGMWQISYAAPPTSSVGPLPVSPETCTQVISRENAQTGQWADTVIVRYTFRDSTGAQHLIIGAKTTGTPGNTKVMVVDERDVTVTQAQADARATALLNTVSVRAGRSWTLTAPSDYTVHYRWRYDFTPPGATSSVPVYVSDISWSLPSATMTLALREIV